MSWSDLNGVKNKKCLIFTKYINGKKPNSNMYIEESVGEDIKKKNSVQKLEQEKQNKKAKSKQISSRHRRRRHCSRKTYLDLIIRQDGALFLSSC